MDPLRNGCEDVDRGLLLERARGAYLGLALGDALGAATEFMTPGEIRSRHGTLADIVGGGWLRLQPGQVTDDTTMSLALGESIIARGCVDPAAVAEAFSRWMRAKPVDIGHTVRRGVVRFRRTGVPCAPYDVQGAGNGACMRCLPVALAAVGQDRATVRRWSLAQARVTHNNELSDVATCFVVESIQSGLAGAGRDGLLPAVDRFASEHGAFDPGGRRQLNPGGYIVETLRAVLQALRDQDTFEDCLVDVVNRGGDADTTGAIAGAICGALYGVGALPERWLDVLDRDIRRACEFQAVQLIEQALARMQ